MSSSRTQKGQSLAGLSVSGPPAIIEAVNAAGKMWESQHGTERLWQRDASLWTGADESGRLGWLAMPDEQLRDVSRFKAFAAEIAEDGFAHLVVLGMGGTSLLPAVLAQTFGKQANAPQLLTLDSTDPAQIRALRGKIDPARTLFCVSSKSGTTLETNLFLRYFYEEARQAVGDRAGHHFVAVTDPGSPLEAMAQQLGFRRVYSGVPSIGGRYSAFSDFGLIPHAGMGLDTERFLKRAQPMVEACASERVEANPGVRLGLLLGTVATQFGIDKLMICCSPPLVSLGGWLEQLLAESLGKQGRGLIPIHGELPPEQPNDDTLFVDLRTLAENDADEASLAELKQRSPVARIVLNDLHDLSQILFQWQIATAVAGSLLKVNAFDQPAIEASKAAIRLRADDLKAETALVESDGMKIFAAGASGEVLKGRSSTTLGGILRKHLDLLESKDYFAMLAYLPMFPEYEALLQNVRAKVLEAKKVATVLNFGPRFSHSTAQVFKGGPNSGVFLLITSDDVEDLAVPGELFTFGAAKAGQARSDFDDLAQRGRRVLRMHLGKDVKAGLARLHDLVCAAFAH